LRTSVIRRIEKLEVQLKPLDPRLPQVDFGLLVESEQAYFSREMRLLRTKARELGYGDGPEANLHSVGWFDLGDYDPVINDEVRLECLEALDEKERQIVETLGKVVEKALRLTALLSEEEKEQIKKYNEVARFFGSYLMMGGTKKRYTEQEFAELGFQYDQIMAKYGEKTIE
jgi:hypothetical protein